MMEEAVPPSVSVDLIVYHPTFLQAQKVLSNDINNLQRRFDSIVKCSFFQNSAS